MKVVIFAGGRGTRLAEETEVRPKPMVEIGGRPILWHIMKQYAHHGFKEFIVALGYRGELIKEFFLDYHRISRDVTVDLTSGHIDVRKNGDAEDWIVHLENTGLDSLTGERLRRLKPHVQDATFMATYGDGVSNVDLGALLEFHQRMGKIATVTAVRPPSRYGRLTIDDDLVTQFTEKPQTSDEWINGGFLVFEPRFFEYLPEGNVTLEVGALEHLAAAGELACYRHHDFWQCMDTTRELIKLRGMWDSGAAPWKVWAHDCMLRV